MKMGLLGLIDLIPTSAFPWEKIIAILFFSRWRKGLKGLPFHPVHRHHRRSHARPAIHTFVLTSRRPWTNHHFLFQIFHFIILSFSQLWSPTSWQNQPNCVHIKEQSGPSSFISSKIKKKGGILMTV